MKKFLLVVGCLALLVGAFNLSHAATQVCKNTDFMCFESGPFGNELTPFRIDSSGNITSIGYHTITGDILHGTIGTATTNSITAASSGDQIPVLVSTAIIQGMAIIATTVYQSGVVNGVMSATSGQQSVLGIADTTASSGTVVNVDYSGLALALTSGTVTVGDLLVSTVTWPGYLVTNNSASAGATVATALKTQASSYNGLTPVLVHH